MTTRIMCLRCLAVIEPKNHEYTHCTCGDLGIAFVAGGPEIKLEAVDGADWEEVKTPDRQRKIVPIKKEKDDASQQGHG